jgi:zinc protease
MPPMPIRKGTVGDMHESCVTLARYVAQDPANRGEGIDLHCAFVHRWPCHTMIQRWLFALTLLLAAVLASAQALPSGLAQVTQVEGITEYRLANGLQVLLVPDDAKPTTTVNVTYRVGSAARKLRRDRHGPPAGAPGLQGHADHRNVWAEFSKRGLRANGTTGIDRTNYFASFAANDDNLRWYLAGRPTSMVNSFIAKQDLDTEMTVVRNEFESGENNPAACLQQTLATMYQWHNYGKSTIGARTDMENVDIPRLQAFYRHTTSPTTPPWW